MVKGRFDNLVNQRFGRLLVIKRAPNQGRRVYWVCRCDCGTVREIRGDSLQNGSASSCGCYHKDVVTKHGMWSSPEYATWNSMLQRCENPAYHAYSRYGGRGIKVCERWHDFETFYHDMYPKPSKRHSLDRIDNDGDYCPENCRWATKVEQSNNRADNHVLTYKGERGSVAEWARRFGISWTTLSQRVKRGWTTEDALETPVCLGNRWRRQGRESA